MDADLKRQLIDEIYQNFPRKEGKSAGVKKLQKLITTSSVGAEILKATKNYTRVVEYRKTERQYILLFSTFINGRWEDYTDISHIVPNATGDLSFV